MRTTSAFSWACAALTLLSACTGTIAPGQARDDRGGTQGSDGGAGGKNPRTGGQGGGDVANDSACRQGLTHGAVFLRRLTNEEYDNTIADLLGYSGRASSDFGLLPDSFGGGFDTNAEAISISTSVFEKYEIAAQALGTALAKDATKIEKVAGCKPSDGGCLDKFITRFGRRAFRRPLTAEERTALSELGKTGSSATDSFSQVLQGILLSPNFLQRPEVGTPDPDKPGLVRLSGFEMATRLSYSFLRTTPSEELLDLAAEGALDTAEGVEETARALLRKTQARSAVRTFLTQWFRLDKVRGLRFEEKKYTWSEQLAASTVEETQRLLEHFTWDESARFTDAIDAPFSFIDATLAEHYGVPAPQTDWQRVDWKPSDERSGLITQGSVLALTSKPDHVSAILRGKWIREALLCTYIPPPPPGVPPLSDPVPGESEQQRFDRHNVDPGCKGCHQMLDPLGAGLSRYDATGARRDKDDLGQPVTTAGKIVGDDDNDVSFDGALELTAKLKSSADVSRCAVTHLFRYAMGRIDDDDDACAIEQLQRAFDESKHNLPEMLVAFARSDIFRYRQPLTAQRGDDK